MKPAVAAPLRIAVFIQSRPHSGGGFEQALSTIEALSRQGVTPNEVIAFTAFEDSCRRLQELGINAISYQQRGYRFLDRLSTTLFGNALFRRLRRLGLPRIGRHLDALLDEHRIDLVVLNEYGDTAIGIGDHPFIVTVWDLIHRDHPDLPEKFTDRQFERLERSLGLTLTRAVAVIANAESGAERIVKLYGVDPKRIVILPVLPSVAVRRHVAGRKGTSVETLKRKYQLPERYVLYPAYFLPQKNHLYLLEGLMELERRHGIVLPAVLCGGGGHPGHEDTVRRQVRALGLEDRVRFLGLVPDEDIPGLYECATALVMPSYTGPTNLPPLEATVLGCPVICSDLPAAHEQMRDAALYCDLRDPASLADQLHSLLHDEAARDRLSAARQRLAGEILSVDYSALLAPVIEDFAYLRRRWAWPAPRGR